MRNGYDSECELLAIHFLNDARIYDSPLRQQLAQAIQDAVEDFFAANVPHTASKDCWCEPTVERPLGAKDSDTRSGAPDRVGDE